MSPWPFCPGAGRGGIIAEASHPVAVANKARLTRRTPGIEEILHACEGRDLDARYPAYFECFNRGFYYEAHEVLEKLWLADRQGPDAAFYKGLIQLAGAFVHLQKSRLRPAASLFKRAQEHLRLYSPVHKRLAVNGTLGLIDAWLARLQSDSDSVKTALVREQPAIGLLEVD